MKDILIGELLPEYWESVKHIYANGLTSGVATFETAVPEWDNWDKAHLQFGRIVAIVDDQIVGWVALSPVSNRCVYGGVAETSVYVLDSYRGKGVGKRLLVQAIEISEANGIWTLQAGVLSENIASLKLHESVGFRTVGFREKIGQLKGAWKDTILLERRSNIVGYY